MRTRVESLLGADCSRMWVSTFHSLCARLLRREAPAIGLSRDFVIYDSADQLSAVKQALKDLHIDDSFVQPRAALSRISHAKNRMESPEAMAAAAGWNRRDEHVAKVYTHYLKALKDSSALDFDDLLAAQDGRSLQQAQHVREKYANQFRSRHGRRVPGHEPAAVSAHRAGLAGVHRNLCVVGDPDQSIYKWRGADLRNILDFNRILPEAATVKLERNYRSTQIILDAASAVIGQNRNRKDKHLWTERKGGARIVYFRGGDELEEADFITRTARSGLADDVDAKVAVLYRTNAQSRTIEDALMREGLAYKVVGGVRFYERKEIKDTLAYLKLIINPHDDVSLRRVINVPARGIGKGVMEALENVAPDGADDLPLLSAGLQPTLAANSLWARLVRGLEQRAFTGRAAASLAVFRDLLVALTEIARQDSVSIAIGKTLDRSGYLNDLREDRSEDSEARIENLAELVSAREDEGREPEPTLGGFVDRLSLLSDVDEEQGDQNARIWLMTLHSAKGLEFPDGDPRGPRGGVVSPLATPARTTKSLEEERRLCYVGMTRARQRLVLTGAARRRVFGDYQAERAVPVHRRGAGRAHRSSRACLLELRLPGQLPALRISRTNPYGRGRRAAKEDVPTYAATRTRISPTGHGAQARHARPASPVRRRERHQHRGLERRYEARRALRGRRRQKTLRAKFAHLEPA